MLFIHGIGIGLYPYVNFLAQINGRDENDDDGEVGIIAIEIMPVSFRITNPALGKDEMCGEILDILRQHGWDQGIVLVSHSYGSVITTHLLHNQETSRLFGPVVLIDPVSILLHLPVSQIPSLDASALTKLKNVAYNFTCRKPKEANELQLYCKSIVLCETNRRC